MATAAAAAAMAAAMSRLYNESSFSIAASATLGVTLLTIAAALLLHGCLGSRRGRRSGNRSSEELIVADARTGALAAASAAADAGRYPWNLAGGSYTELQACTARLAAATMLHARLAAESTGPAGTSHVSGLADLIEMVGERLSPRSQDERTVAEAAAYHSGWEGPDWMDTTDELGGFRQMVHYPQFRLAVSKSGRLQGDVREVCPPPAGWRIATSADILASGMRRFAPTKSPKQYIYMDQGGWTCCTWPERSRSLPDLPWGERGVERIYFLTEDWEETEPAEGGSLHAQYTEGTLTGSYTTASLRQDLPQGLFAGIVCVREDQSQST